MATSTSLPRAGSVRVAGALAALIGAAALLVYTLYLPYSTGRTPVPELRSGIVVWTSTVVGPLLLTWGWFAMRNRTVSPLTPRRALLVPVLSCLASIGGIARFAYGWLQATPFESTLPTGAEDRTIDPSVVEIVRMEFGSLHVFTLVTVAFTVVGTVSARGGRRSTLASVALPLGMLAIGTGVAILLDDVNGFLPSLLEIGTIAVLACLAFGVGYLAAKPPGVEHGALQR